MQSDSPPPSVPLVRVFLVWLAFGLQSFGGGAATLALIRRGVVERHRWVSEADFTRDWAICQVAPGINLLAMTILIGRRTAGVPGIVLSLLGLLLPSVAATIALTAGYAPHRDSAVVQAAVRAVVPATVGLGLVTAFQMAIPPLRELRGEGIGYGAFGLVLIAASGAAVLSGHVPVVAALLGAGCISAVLHGVRARTRKRGES